MTDCQHCVSWPAPSTERCVAPGRLMALQLGVVEMKEFDREAGVEVTPSSMIDTICHQSQLNRKPGPWIGCLSAQYLLPDLGMLLRISQ